MASQEQVTATNPSIAAAATNLSPTSVSSPSNSQTQLTSSLVASVPNAAQLQQLQKQPPQVTAQAASTVNLPYSYTPALAATGYPSLANQQYGLAAAVYDPKSMVAVASKLKMLPTATGVKLDQRYAPY